MTHLTGHSFLSYRRTRASEVALLIAAQHDVGIPTWQDIHNLDEEHTETELRRVLLDPDTANAILWLTPDVAQSVVIRQIEIPEILKRRAQQDDFFVLPVLAGGLAYGDVEKVVDNTMTLQQLQQWNLRRTQADPIDASEAADLAKRILRRRIRTIHQSLPPQEPISLVLYTRTKAPFSTDVALTLDWSHRFQDREATADTWEQHLLPALRTVADVLHTEAPGRAVVASGLPVIPAATALGAAFLAPRNQRISWRQSRVGMPDMLISLEASQERSGLARTVDASDVNGKNLAVLVSVAANAEPGFLASWLNLPVFRAIARVAYPYNNRDPLTTPGQVVEVAYMVRDCIRQARDTYPQIGHIHLFMAVPVGLAMLIGQLLNTFGPVQTYEHISDTAVGHYRPAALLHPSA